MRGEVEGFLAALPLAALVIRRDERIEAANSGAMALLGPGIAGRHFITALRQPSLLDAIESCLRDGAARRAEYLTRENGHDATYRVQVGSVVLDSGPGVLVSFEDVTPLERVGQMRRDFVANVSHELRTPLTALMGFIETLKGPARGDPVAQARFLAVMEAEAARMNRLIGDLLSLSRVEAEERVRPTDRVDPADLVRATLSGLSGLAEEAGVTLEAAMPERAFSISGDADQLRQVLTNLVENGIKYAGRGAVVRVTLGAPEMQPRLRAEGVVLTVSDSGPGIDPLHLPRLTERFYRVDGHRSREKGGTGLGLAIVKHIVNRHRGRMRIESEPGRGTRFTVVLPVG
ncbi:sensor histidine kinase [Sagittula salina]|uniref:histidine kinase n=1 Tax=Sagittula salina TaxID=2820268 RepID=A0A940MHX6_9RHOB|nr:ATP-binding protein [Sagittula salina]MBP0482065.1 two-component sensor histidine kinase [Sagittula salina]